MLPRRSLLFCVLVAASSALINGRFERCPQQLLRPSNQTPSDVHHVRPADIAIVAALGDSITTGYISVDGDTPLEGDNSYGGNSFVLGGDGDVKEHVTLTTILKSLNPSLTGYSKGIGLDGENGGLNVAIPSTWSTDVSRQAKELVRRMKKFPKDDMDKEWKLIHIFTGTNDQAGICWYEPATTKDAYKKYILQAIKTIQSAIPRTIISLIGIWDIGFCVRAGEIVEDQGNLMCADVEPDAIAKTQQYRDALKELEADASLQSSQHAVVYQSLFDLMPNPPKRKNGSYMKEFYASDLLHLSKYGNSLVGKQLWAQLLQPVGKKRTTIQQLVDERAPLACPDKACPYIRTVVNSKKC